MNYGAAILGKIGMSIEELDDLLKILELPRVDHQFETFRAISFPNEGVEFAVASDRTLVSVHLFSEGLDGKTQYHRELPFGLTFGDQEKDVAKKLDRLPEASGGGNNWRGKETPKWNRYCLNSVLVHFQYSRVDGGVELITMMAQNHRP